MSFTIQENVKTQRERERASVIVCLLTGGNMTSKLFGDFIPHRRGNAATHVQFIVRIPYLRIFFDSLQQLGSIDKGIFFRHDSYIQNSPRYLCVLFVCSDISSSSTHYLLMSFKLLDSLGSHIVSLIIIRAVKYRSQRVL